MKPEPICSWIRVGMLCLICGFWAVGCKKKDRNAEMVEYKQLAEYAQINGQVAALHKVYFNGSADEARSSLLKEEEFLNQVRARHLQDDYFSGPNQMVSTGLRLAYARLYALEVLQGDTNAASGYLERIKNCISNDLRNGNVSSNEVAAAVGRIKPENIPNAVHKWDIAVNHGEDPKYRINLQPVGTSAP